LTPTSPSKELVEKNIDAVTYGEEWFKVTLP
jgi:hypothetical protein